MFVRDHVCISCRYDWMFASAMFMSCVVVMVMSSAYVVSFTSACGVGECQVCIC